MPSGPAKELERRLRRRWKISFSGQIRSGGQEEVGGVNEKEKKWEEGWKS